MAKFMMAYYGGNQPSSKEEGMAQMKKWKEWVESLGDKIINPGTPLMNTKIVTSNKVENEIDPNAMKGFAIIQAENLESALDIAKTDPFLKVDGKIHLSEMMEME